MAVTSAYWHAWYCRFAFATAPRSASRSGGWSSRRAPNVEYVVSAVANAAGSDVELRGNAILAGPGVLADEADQRADVPGTQGVSDLRAAPEVWRYPDQLPCADHPITASFVVALLRCVVRDPA